MTTAVALDTSSLAICEYGVRIIKMRRVNVIDNKASQDPLMEGDSGLMPAAPAVILCSEYDGSIDVMGAIDTMDSSE